MKSDKEINDWLDEQGVESIIPDGYPGAFVGVTTGEPAQSIYDQEAIIKILMERDGMTREDALEFFSFNIEGAHMEGGPIYIKRP